jgi:hypothetical protein
VATQSQGGGMNKNTLRLLLFVVVVLVAALWLIESGGDSDLPEAGTPLLPDLRAVANDIDAVTVQRAGQPPLTIQRSAGGWIVPDRGDYPANVDALRALLLAMAEAAVVEAKTANPALHDRLGVGAPSTEDSTAVLVSARTGDNEFAVVFGNVAQGSYRYARIADQDQSWLIDQNPDLPAGVADWLDKDIVDIDSSQVRSVTVSHPDGETISISKSAEADTNFDVADIPEGRQLTYSTVANGIAGALNDLDLDDVRPATGSADGAVLATFETFNDLRVVARTATDDDGHWLTLGVEGLAGETEELLALRQRIDGWEFRIADYKANLLTRRWEDILEPLPDETADP